MIAAERRGQRRQLLCRLHRAQHRGGIIRRQSRRVGRAMRIAAERHDIPRRQRPVHVDYVGFEVPDQFLVGYGLDYEEDYRSLPDVCILEG